MEHLVFLAEFSKWYVRAHLFRRAGKFSNRASFTRGDLPNLEKGPAGMIWDDSYNWYVLLRAISTLTNHFDIFFFDVRYYTLLVYTLTFFVFFVASIPTFYPTSFLAFFVRHSFWGPTWQLPGHSIWHSIWLSFCRVLRYSFWHCVLAFYLAFGILLDVLFGIYSGIPSGIISGIPSGIYSDILSGILSGIYSDILSICHYVCHVFGSVSAQTDPEHTIGLRSVRAQTELELAISFWSKAPLELALNYREIQDPWCPQWRQVGRRRSEWGRWERRSGVKELLL